MIPEIKFEFPEVPQINFLIDLQGQSLYQKWLELGLGTGDYAAFLVWLKVKGDSGASAYDVAVELGFVGTQAEWVASLKGEKGEKGDQGDKGDDFTYEDFTPEQIEGLKVKGDPFLYSDFTPAQIAELQRPATEAVTAVNEAEALRVTAEATRVENEQGRDTAEGLRVSAEADRQDNEIARGNAEDDREDAEALRLSAEITRGQNEQARITAESTRQTNTATAITNANNAASNANTKAGLADTAANNANTKATLANDAAILANEKAGLANTAATNADNARLAIQGDLALKEATANKQNSLTADETGTKFPTVNAVIAGINAKSNLLVDYTHTSNIEIGGFTVDTATGIFTKAGHGLANNDLLYVCINAESYTLLLKDVTYNEFLSTASMNSYVVNATTNTFQLSLTSGGAAITTLTPLAGTDISKWHFEKRTAGGVYDTMEFTGIASVSNNATNLKIVIAGGIAIATSGGHLFFNINDLISDTKYIAYLGSGTASKRSTYTLLRADAFGYVIYDVTCDMNITVIKKELSFIKDRDLTLYSENQIFVSNRGRIADVIRLHGCYFKNGTTVRIYQY